MKQKNLETILYSTAGVVVMFVVLLAFYIVSSAAKDRVDLTKDKAFTLSDGTKKILGKLDAPVTIRFYSTQSGVVMPPVLRNYAQHIEDLLAEYKEAGHGKVIVKKFDPAPDSDAEDSARLDGISGQQIQFGGDRVYLGVAISMADEKQSVPWLPPDRERMLEYDITRAISRVIHPTPPVLGVMSALPIFGGGMNPMMARQMGQAPQEPAAFISEIKKDFTVREVPLTATKIDDDIKVLLVVHPREVTDATQYALDQFVLRGGKLLAFLDPHAYFDQKHDQMAQVLGESSGQSSLDKLLKGWGLDMDLNKVVADMTFAGHNQQAGAMPGVLLLTQDAINRDDIVTSELDNLVMPFAGAITGKPADGLKETVLVHSSADSSLVDGITAGVGGEQIVKDFKPSNVQYALAVRLEGKFKTAFPNGAPKPEKDDKEPDQSKAPQLKEATGNGVVILVGDSDMLNDQVCVRVQEILGYRMVQPMNGNLNFVESMVEQLSGDNDLISLRSRASLDRPFTRLKEMQAKAGRQWEAKLKELEGKKMETERRISELQQQKGGNEQKFIVSPEQQKELENYQKTVADANKELKNVKKQLNKEQESLEFWTKVANIAAMPLLVALTGIVLSVVKHNLYCCKMNLKQLIILIVALVLVGGAGLVLHNKHEESWSTSEGKIGEKLLPHFQVNDVAAIHVTGESELNLVKKNDQWIVQERNYPANFSEIKDLLMKMGDLKIAQSDAIGASQLGRMHLAEGKGPDSATVVEFKDSSGKVLDALLLGKKHVEKSERPSPMGMGGAMPDGRYVMLKDDPKTVLTVSDPLNSLDPKPANWLNKDFFKVERVKSLAFVSTMPADSWTVSRGSETESFALENQQKSEILDSNKLASLASTLSYPSFVDVATNTTPVATGMDRPLTVTITTFDQFVYHLKIGLKTPENNYYMMVDVDGDFPTTRLPPANEKPDDKKRMDKIFDDALKTKKDKLALEKSLKGVYVVNSWLIEPLIRHRSELMEEKKDEKKEADASETEQTVGERPPTPEQKAAVEKILRSKFPSK